MPVKKECQVCWNFYENKVVNPYEIVFDRHHNYECKVSLRYYRDYIVN